MKNKFEVGNVAKVLVNNKYWFRGEIIDIKDDIATVAVPVYYVDCYDYIPVESNIKDLREVK